MSLVRMGLIIGSGMLLLNAQAQLAAQSSNSNALSTGQQASGSVQGRVLDSLTGIGVAGAGLHLFPRSGGTRLASPANTTSAEDGSFHFDQVNPGSYVLFCTDADYVIAANQNQTLTVGEGQQVTDLSIPLNPLGDLQGKVLDEAGKGVPGIKVELFSAYNEQGATQLRRMQATNSGAAGQYRFAKVRPGKYYVAAGGALPDNHPKWSDTPPQEKEKANPPPLRTAEGIYLNIVRTFYPKAIAFDNASSLDVAPGGAVPDANIQLQRAETFHVSGKVEAVGPVALRRGAILSLAPRDTPAIGGTGKTETLRPDQTFVLDRVASGSYTLWLLGSYRDTSDSMLRRMRILARQDIDVNASNVENVQLSLLPQVNLTGHIVSSGSSLSNAPSQMRVNLTPLQKTSVGRFLSLPVVGSGTFGMENVDPGQYMIRVSNVPSGSYVKAILWNQQDVTTSGIDLSQGSGGELEIVLRNGAAEIEGSVTGVGSAKTVSGTVVLIPENIPLDGADTAISQIRPDGTFAIPNLPPGHYNAYAVEHWTSLWRNVTFLNMMQRSGKPVAVEENGHAQLQLPLLTVDELQSDASALGLSLQ